MSYAYLFKYIIIGATHTQPDLLIAAFPLFTRPTLPIRPQATRVSGKVVCCSSSLVRPARARAREESVPCPRSCALVV